MSTPDRSPSSADRNLLFGILALQMDFLGRDALIAAMHAWVLDKAKSLGRILVEQRALAEEEYDLLEALMRKHLQRHSDDAQRSLAAVSSLGSARQQLEQIADAELRQSLAHVSVARAVEDDPFATRPPSAGVPTSAGQRFHILRPHARGGLGEVFVAHDVELNREVALKEIQDRHADDKNSRSRFMLEAETTGGLEHPGIVPVYGLGQYSDGRPFYAMRFIRGDSLQDAIAHFYRADAPGRDAGERALSLRQLLSRFIDVCNAIAYAHSRGVLHRDLKPGNIMLGKYGETLVVDWGLAKPLGRAEGAPETMEGPLQPSSASRSAPTQMGSAIGTPAYMPPEQAAGRLDQLGPTSDVYSLGATLYCLLTGVPPFEGTDLGAILRQVERGEFRPPRQVKDTVPAALEAVCLQAMALRPEDRYASPGALAEDVEHWLADEPVGAWREPWEVKARRWVSRHRTLVTAGAATLLVATVSLIAATVLLQASNTRERQANSDKEVALGEKEMALGKAEANAAEARRQEEAARERKRQAEAHAAEAKRQTGIAEKRATDLRKERDRTKQSLAHISVLLADREWDAGHVRRARELLDDVPRELRRWEWGYLRRKSQGSYCTLYGHTSGVTSVAFSPDGRRLASASGDNTVKVWDAATGGEILTLKGHTSYVTSVAFSPDGQRLASASAYIWGNKSGEVKVWDAATGGEVLTLRHRQSVTSVAFSPDGRRLASASGDHTVKVWDAATGGEILTLKGHTSGVTSVAFSPDGRRLASASVDQTVKVWDAATGGEVRTLKGHINNVNCVAFSPDGQRLASASLDHTVKVWDAATGGEILTFKGHTSGVIREFITGVISVAFSPDGQRLASSEDQTVKVWNAATGQEVLTLRHTAYVTSVAFSPDGQRLASASVDQTVKVWDAATGQEVHTLKGHTSYVTSVAFSPDGKTLWSKDYNNIVKAWNLNTGKEVPNPGTAPPFAGAGVRHPSAPLLAFPEGATILLIDLSLPDASELAFRAGKAAFDFFWHLQQATQSEKKRAWFAAAFHRAQLAEHAPWDALNWEKLERACDQLGDYQPARAVCDRLLQRDPTLAPLYLRRSGLRMGGKDTWGSLADLLRAAHLSISDHPEWTTFADAAAEQGKEAADKAGWPQAARHYTLASVWQPHNPWHLHRLAWATLAAGNEEGYRTISRRLHARFGKLEGKRDLLALSVMLAQRMQPLTPAPLVIDRAVALDAAKRAGAIAYTATLLPDSGIDSVILLELTAREVQVDPTNANDRGAYGAALYRAGKHKEAVEQLKKAVQIQGGNSNNWQELFLAMAYHKMGDAAKSREWFDKAKLDPKESWEGRLIYRRLHDEAEQLRKSSDKSGQPPARRPTSP